MPLKKLQFQPTVNREGTAYTSEPVWYDCDKIRIRAGLPETIGGWVPLTLSSSFLGICRSLLAWNSISGVPYLGVGTSKKYYVELGGTYFDITPIRRSITLTDPFTTVTTTLAAALNSTATTATLTSTANLPSPGKIKIGTEVISYVAVDGTSLLGLSRGQEGTTAQSHATGALVASGFVKVTDLGSSVATGDFVTFSGAGALGGLPPSSFNGEQTAVFQGDPNSYFFLANSFPTATATGGGSVIAAYQEYIGLENFLPTIGYGVPPYGQGGYGAASIQVALSYRLRIWNHANFGEDLLFGPRGGGLYYWFGGSDSSLSSRGTPAALLPGASDVPLFQNKIIVTDARIAMVFGTNAQGSTDFDAMLIRWSDQELPQVWTSTPINVAGDLRLTNGTQIVTAIQTRQEILVFTDSALYSIQFVGGEDVFIQQLVSENITITGPNAVCVANGVVYWMGKDKFYVYSGRSDTLPTTLKTYVFDDINKEQSELVVCGSNEGFNEVWWFYPSAKSLQNDRYVIYNYAEQSWYYGTMERSAWLDSGRKPLPLAASPRGLVFHEQGTDDNETGTPKPINAFIESGDFDIEDGDRFGLVQRIIPDINFLGSSAAMPEITMQVSARKSSGAAYRAEESPQVVLSVEVPVPQYTDQVYVRVRGRQMKLRVASNMLGVRWQLGYPRIDVRPDGRK